MRRFEVSADLWQVGLAPSCGRSWFATVVPVDADFSGLLARLFAMLPETVVLIPSRGFAHVSLAGSEEGPVGVSPPPFSLVWQGAGVVCVGGEVRLLLEVPDWSDFCASLGVDAADPYVTLGYAVYPVASPSASYLAASVSGVHLGGVLDRVEHRVFDGRCASFAPRVVRPG